MDLNLPRLYKEYGIYSNYRNFPLDIDGLKPVERRVLLSAYKIARNSLVKSRQVDAYTIGHYHPHGECYGTIVQLVRQGFLLGQGNWGSNAGVEPVGAAAPRYTECRIHPKTIELAFKYIDHVPWVDTELGDREPFYLPTMFPVCLMGIDYSQGIGFGFKTYIPCYQVPDLYQRLLWLLGLRKQKPIISPITDCNILSDKKELDGLLTTGKAQIKISGIIKIDNKRNKIVLNSWPPGKRFRSFLNKFSKELNEGLIGYVDLSSGNQTKISFEVLRERNRDKIFNEFVAKMQEALLGVISFDTIVVDTDQKVLTKSIDNMLLDTYKMFCTANETMLKYEIKNNKETIDEYNALEIVRKPLSECIKSGFDAIESIEIIEKETGVKAEVIRFLIGKYRISKLLTLDTDTTELKNKIINFENSLKNLTEFVLEQYNGL
jgi:DNA gyrase/topoisomerase IV subunit A